MVTDEHLGPVSLDLSALQFYLAEHRVPIGNLSHVELITSGRSNLTFVVSGSGQRWIVRRPPLGHILPTAHNMAREYRVLASLAGTSIPVPKPIHLCIDSSAIGSPFLIMDYVDGTVIDSVSVAQALSEADAHRCACDFVDCLLRIHALSIAELGLAEFGRPDGYLSRQLTRWSRQWKDSSAGGAPEGFDELKTVLRTHMPSTSRNSLVQGDPRLGNVIFRLDQTPSIGAVIDWEMSTLGDPLCDLGLLLAYWDPASASITPGPHVESSNAGFPGAEEIIERYCRGAQISSDSLGFYRVFGFFKLAAIGQTIVARDRLGLAVGEGLPLVKEAVALLIDAAFAAAHAYGLT